MNGPSSSNKKLRQQRQKTLQVVSTESMSDHVKMTGASSGQVTMRRSHAPKSVAESSFQSSCQCADVDDDKSCTGQEVSVSIIGWLCLASESMNSHQTARAASSVNGRISGRQSSGTGQSLTKKCQSLTESRLRLLVVCMEVGLTSRYATLLWYNTFHNFDFITSFLACR